ncbi:MULTISPECIES: hypothetical protein [unclassified Haloparvum]|uniref:hypothetical protein n=1 Tax=Haloparvum sp. PAK95 TaxID=3418962 RepID=UPI003D2F18F4
MSESTDNGGVSDRIAFYGSVVFGLALATGSVWFFNQKMVLVEALQRVHPTVSGGGVGAAWEYGIGVESLNLAIKLLHIADIVLGFFILVMVFIHWASFHRLAAQMKPPAGSEAASSDAAATDGGERQ